MELIQTKKIEGFFYRIEHSEDCKGIFKSSHVTPLYDDGILEDVVKTIHTRFLNMESMFRRLEEVGYSYWNHGSEAFDYNNMHCAFKNIEDLIHYIELNEFKALHKAGFNIVRIEGSGLFLKDQIAFRQTEVKKRTLKVEEVELLYSKKVAQNDLKKTLKITDHIILE